MKLAQLVGNWIKDKPLTGQPVRKMPTFNESALPSAVKQFRNIARLPQVKSGVIGDSSLSCERSTLRTGVHLRISTATCCAEKGDKGLGTKIKIDSVHNLISHVNTWIDEALSCTSPIPAADKKVMSRFIFTNLIAMAFTVSTCLMILT